MNKSKSQLALSILIMLAFLSSCSGSDAKPKIVLESCTGYWNGIQALCGTLRVRENRAEENKRMIDLKVVVIKAGGENPASDPIFYLAGGPGGAAASEDARNQQLPSSLSDNHDLVFVDQRGTGGSNRVLVPSNPPDLSGLSPEEADAKAKAWVADYLAEIDMDPRYYTTSLFADDLDEVRQALGYDKINLFGCSYGATAAQYYLRQYEEHVRTATLCAGSLLDIPVFEFEPQRTQQALNNIFELCLADSKCGAAFPNVKAEFNQLMMSLETEPKVVSYNDPTNSQPVNITFTAEYFAGIVRNLMKDAKNDPLLPLLIHRAAVEDNWQGFINLIRGGASLEWWGDQIMERVIRCSEKWAAFDPARVAELSQGSFMAVRSNALSQAQAISCRYTPTGVTPEGMTAQPHSNVPVLIFNGSLDPIDPPENMAGASDIWPNSLAFSLPYQAHQQSNMTAIYCFFSIMDDFIQSGSAKGLDTSCLQTIPPPLFLVP